MIIHIGETENAAMSRQLTRGIQHVDHVIWAVRAILKHGAAMRATTAGRTPRKNFSTQTLSLKLWKKMAMSRIATIEGQGYAQRSDDASPHSAKLVAYVARHVDGEYTGGGLRHHHDIHKLLTVKPMVLVDILPFHYWNHGIAATKGERSNLIAGEKEF